MRIRPARKSGRADQSIEEIQISCAPQTGMKLE
jgi:hypothetical protein